MLGTFIKGLKRVDLDIALNRLVKHALVLSVVGVSWQEG